MKDLDDAQVEVLDYWVCSWCDTEVYDVAAKVAIVQYDHHCPVLCESGSTCSACDEVEA